MSKSLAPMNGPSCMQPFASRHRAISRFPSTPPTSQREFHIITTKNYSLNRKCTRRIHVVAQSSSDAMSSGDVSLAPNREGYRSFVMQGSEFLVRQTPDGSLILSDTFIIDEATGASTRAAIIGDVSSSPRSYQPTEVAIEYPGNVFEGKEATRTVVKVYLVTIVSEDPYIVDIEDVHLLDSAKRSVERLQVERLAPPDTPQHELRARIRDRWIVIDTAASIPTPEVAVRAAMAGGTAMSRLEMEAKERREASSPSSSISSSSGSGTNNAYDSVGNEKKTGDTQAAMEKDGQGSSTGGGYGPGDTQGTTTGDNAEGSSNDILYDEELLKDFMVEVDDESETDFEEYDMDMPASDY